MDRPARRAALVVRVAPVRGTIGGALAGGGHRYPAQHVRVAGAAALPGFEPVGRRAGTPGCAGDATVAGLVAATVGAGSGLAGQITGPVALPCPAPTAVHP